jgi:phosphoribosyl 1,2-cyclic phosphodiesterase
VTLTVRFWGTRGSIPTPGPSTARYGGNTACVEVRSSDGSLLILDAGTGIRGLGRALVEAAGGAPITGDIFLSHTHWDHIQGLPFFEPLYRNGNRFRIWSAPESSGSVARALREQMSPAVFPVALGEVEGMLDFRALCGEHSGPGYTIDSFPLRHPGGALGYRIRDNESRRTRLVYISDNELGDADGYDTHAGWRDELVSFARDARVLVHDATFTPGEYQRHRGWGHSPYPDALALALDAGVEQLVLFHHHPDRSDEELDLCLSDARTLAERNGNRLEVLAAAEGMVLKV